MTEWSSDVELGPALIDLGAHVAVPEHSLWPRVRAQLEENHAPRAVWPLWVVVAAVIAVIAISVVSIAPARHAVADLLGIGATQVQHVDRLPHTEATRPLPSNGDRARLAEQLAQAHLFEPDTVLAGEPVGWLIAPLGETVVAYEHVVLSQRELAGAGPSIKRYAGGANVQFVQVGQLPAVYVSGEHTRTIDGHTFRSGNSLIWDNDGVELRLEGDLPLDEMLSVARSVTRGG
ncbi:MAG: DUF4367 domain-containing protein [Acidimicrobiia bacterium]